MLLLLQRGADRAGVPDAVVDRAELLQDGELFFGIDSGAIGPMPDAVFKKRLDDFIAQARTLVPPESNQAMRMNMALIARCTILPDELAPQAQELVDVLQSMFSTESAATPQL